MIGGLPLLAKASVDSHRRHAVPLTLWERPVCCVFILDCPAEKSPKPPENQGFWAMVLAAGLERTMEHPAETPGGNSPPDCYIWIGSSPSPLDTKKENPRSGFSFLVPVTGLEPVRCRQRWILSPLRLPFHHTGRCPLSII